MEKNQKPLWQKYNLFAPTEEHQMLRQMVASFVKKEVEPGAFQRDREEFFDLALLRKMGKLGLLGLSVPEEYGGAALDALAVVLVHEELSFSDPGLCLAYLAHSILCTHNVAWNADTEQKKQFLPDLCSGKHLGAMAMSEAEAGTDVLGMKTTFQQNPTGFVLNGRKMWITNACQGKDQTLPSDRVLVYAKNSSSDEGEICAFLVERGFKGYRLGQMIKNKTGMRASTTAELVFDHCEIPLSHRIGKKALTGMMRNLELERIALAAISLGIAKRCLTEMNRYASERRAFGQSIREFGQIQKHLAGSYAEYSAARTYVYDVARGLRWDQAGGRLPSDAAKWVAAPVGKKVADRAMQVLGAYGYVAEYHVERFWRDAKLLEIGGGTNEALEKNITKELKKHSSF